MTRGWVSPAGFPHIQIKARRIGGRNTIVGIRIEKADGLTGKDLHSINLAAFEILLNTGPDLRDEAVQRLMRSMLAPPTAKELRLPPTKGHRKPNSFYMEVATLYRWLVWHRKGPATELAAANKVPVTTVHRWIREARARGFLPPQGRKGRAG